jgi:hypothetical protein
VVAKSRPGYQGSQTQATVETAAIEAYSAGSAGQVLLPTFGFSYKVDGDFYSGRFSLLPHRAKLPDDFLRRMVGFRLQVHYDPQHPDAWFIHDEVIEWYRVEQKMGAHLGNFYPT